MRRETSRGVSAVIGTIILVAITVIIASVVSAYVLDIIDVLSEDDGDATLRFSQNVQDLEDETYEVEGLVTFSDTDYIIVTTTNEDADYTTDRVVLDDSDINTDESIPNTDDIDGAIIRDEGDIVTISNLESGDTVTVLAGLDGSETTAQQYDVRDII